MDEKLESIKRGIIECEREIAMAKSKGWDDIADDWHDMFRLLSSRLEYELLQTTTA